MSDPIPRVMVLKSTDEEFVLHLKDWNTLVIAIKKAAISEAVAVQFINVETGEPTTMEILKKTQQVDLSVKFKDVDGDDAPVDGEPLWSIANGAIGHLVDDPGGNALM